MNYQEILNLISIRNYIANIINNSNIIDRATVSELNGTLILIDKKIIEMLKSQEFKSYIGYQEVRQAIEEVAKLNNIKSGLNKK